MRGLWAVSAVGVGHLPTYAYVLAHSAGRSVEFLADIFWQCRLIPKKVDPLHCGSAGSVILGVRDRD